MTDRPIDPLPIVGDPDLAIGEMLKGKRGLVVGIANEHSIAYGAAVKLRAFGADLAVTWLNDKAEPYVRPLAEQLQASITATLDVEKPGELEAVFDKIAKEWGRLDFVIHAIASRRKTICKVAWSTARGRASPRRCTSRAGPSSAWSSSPSR